MKRLFGKSVRGRSEDDVDGEDQEELQELTAEAGVAAESAREKSAGDRQSLAGASMFEQKGRCATYGRTELHKAARKGQLTEVTALLATNLRPTLTDDAGLTPLHDAVLSDAEDADKILELLCSKCDSSCVNRKNNAGQTALHIAAVKGRVKCVEVLLKYKAKINEDNPDKNTCLHLAALGADRKKAAEIVKLMCRDGEADINEPNAVGKTALYMAAACGNADAVRILIENGAKRNYYDENHCTALHAAAICPDDAVSMDVVRELCKDELKAKDANENRSAKTRQNDGARERTLSAGSTADVVDDDDVDFVNRSNDAGKTALHLAAAAGKPNMVRALLKYGALRNVADKRGRTPLHYVAYKCTDDSSTNVVQSIIADLCENKCSPEAKGSFSNRQDKEPNDKAASDREFIDRQDNTHQTALHLAAHYGQLKAVQKLLDYKASVTVPDEAENTPIISAALAKEVTQQAEILEAICSSFEDSRKVDYRNKDSKTALHIVAARGQLNSVKVLLNHGARLDIEDNDKNTALHCALLAQDTSSCAGILSAMLDSKQGSDKKFVRLTGAKLKTALHLAASKGLIDIVNMLLEAGAKLDVFDNDNWTPLHEATACDDDKNSPIIVRKFCEMTDKTYVDRQNADGETALHMAARHGHLTAVKTLLEFRASLEIKDNDGWIPLHSSVRVDPRIVKAIVEAIRSSKQNKPTLKQYGKLLARNARASKNSQDTNLGFRDVMTQLMITRNINKVLNEKDNEGRTALHLAAHLTSTDMIAELKSLNPEIPDRYSMTPLHVAASMPHNSSLRAMLDVFYSGNSPHQVDINHINRDGDSVLHMCCREGSVEKVKLLLRHGGVDLEKKGNKGFTVLHRLVEVYVHNPTKRDSIVSIYYEIINNAVNWKCRLDNRVVPKVDSELYNNSLRQVVNYLVCQLKTKKLNVLQYAAKKGATKLLDAILNTPYVFKNPTTGRFDVTYLIPDTVPESEDKSKKPLSCLELIVNSKDIDQAEDVLSIYPFNELVSNYWVLCRRVYNLFLCAHVLFMSLFTVYCMPTSEFIASRFRPKVTEYQTPAPYTVAPSDVNATLLPNVTSSGQPLPYGDDYYRRTLSLYGLFLIWPAIICFMELISGLEFCYRSYVDLAKSEKKNKRKDDNPSKRATVSRSLSRVFAMGRILMFGFEYVSHVSALAFSISTLAWYLMYVYGDNHHRYCEAIAAVFIFGWMHTITYVKMFKDWHAFASIFKQIVAKDVTRFAYIFVFVLMSFSFAIHALSNSIYPPVTMHARTLAETIYLTFCLTVTVTVGGLLDVSTEPHYEEAGGNIHLLHIVFAGYICLSTIILLNMLIAMMNSTYSAVRSTSATTWRVESLRTALWVERKLPLIKRSLFLHFQTRRELADDQKTHWYIDYTPEQVRIATIESFVDKEEDDTTKCLREINFHISQLADKNASAEKSAAGPATTAAVVQELTAQVARMQEEQRAATEKLESQSQTMRNLLASISNLQILCEKLATDVNKLANK